MKPIGQNSVVLSRDQHLVPGNAMIDGRSERDQLAFLASFASVINFYDNNNTVNGSWAPFLLKDPVFLLASISKTNFLNYKGPYLNTVAKLQSLLGPDKPLTAELREALNILFDQLTDVFMLIEQWTVYMRRSEDVYDLRHFVIHQVKTKFSGLFWAIVAFRESLFASAAIGGIDPPDLYTFEAYDNLVWKQNKDREMYWQVLGMSDKLVKADNPALQDAHEKQNALSCLDALTQAGTGLFDFFQAVIRHAATELEHLENKTSKYPDTTLLRTCVHLLGIHQQQLNGITARHLDFYYKDLLKQKEQPAVPDRVVLCAELGKKDATLLLPAQTAFDAGMDAQKNPIVFVSEKEVILNPAALVKALTLGSLPQPDGLFSFYMKSKAAPGILQKDEDGKIQGWDTFGASFTEPGLQVKPAIAFASPMLLLREGTRSIELLLDLEGAVTPALLNAASWYLSTQTAWLPVHIKPLEAPLANPLNIRIDLDAAQPPIEAFTADPDGIAGQWPMLKIEFNRLPAEAPAPVLNSISIHVTVTGVKTLDLFNDHGALSAKAPFQPFGPLPLRHSNFIIGSKELFSKPLDSLCLTLQWDKLPDDTFTGYYQQYNNYLHRVKPAEAFLPVVKPDAASDLPVPVPQKKNVFQKVGGFFKRGASAVANVFKKAVAGVVKFFSGLFNLFVKFFAAIIKGLVKTVKGLISFLLRIRKVEPAPPRPVKPQDFNRPFNNTCFTVDFFMLHQHLWEPLALNKKSAITVLEGNVISTAPYVPGEHCDPPSGLGTLLFGTTDQPKPCTLLPVSYFATDAPPLTKQITTDPGIQQLPLKYSDASSSGFIKLSLSGPADGFGAGLYANVVSSTALENAIIIGNKGAATDLIAAANPPFAPVVASLSAHYTASQKYVLNAAQDNYPLQCFLYTPFSNYTVYDSRTPAAPEKTEAVHLYPSFGFKGALYLELQDAIPASTLSLYFELLRNPASTWLDEKITYTCLTSGGWKELTVLSDGTNGFVCPGIITLTLPPDLDNTNGLMPGTNNWLRISVQNDPALFPQTVFLKTNGFTAKRSGNLFSPEAPKLSSGIISKPVAAIPQIAALVQPFPSFGGRAAENPAAMHLRVSNRLKTKDRAVSAEDYFRLIRQHFDDVYYSKTIYNAKSKSTGVYVVKAVSNSSEAGAFLPLLSQCREMEIQKFLTQRSSAFSNLAVRNFNLQYVEVSATVVIKNGYGPGGIQKTVSQALNIFLSPWISADASQLGIDSGISDAQAAALIRSIAGVAEVKQLAFTTWIMDGTTRLIKNEAEQKPIRPVDGSTLFVSAMDHTIQCIFEQ